MEISSERMYMPEQSVQDQIELERGPAEDEYEEYDPDEGRSPDEVNPNIKLYADKHYPDTEIELKKLFAPKGASESEEGRRAEQVALDMGQEIVTALAKNMEGNGLAGLATNAHEAAQKLPEGAQRDQLLTFTRLFSLATAEKTGEPVIINGQEV